FSRDWSSDVCSSDLVAFPVSFFENKAQMGGSSRGPPVIAPTLKVNSTMPPIYGTPKAITIMSKPKTQEEARATNISFLSLAPGRSEERRVGKEGISQ